MSKIGSAFGGGGGGKKPSTTEIFLALAQKAKDDEAAALAKTLGVSVGPGNASLAKFQKGRRTKATRLKGGRVAGEEEEDNTIKRPGARSAKLLGQ